MTQPTNPSSLTGATELSKRTPEEIFAHHIQALGTEDLDATLTDYADTAYMVTPLGVLHGKAAIRTFFTQAFQLLPAAQWSVKTTFVENILFLLWTADSPPGSIADGVDTFIFRDGLIQGHTTHFTFVPKT